MERETEREAEREPTKKESRNRHWGGVYMMKKKKKKSGKKERVGNFLAFKTRTPIKFKIKKADTHGVSNFFFF